MSTTPNRYHPALSILHWLLALMLIGALFMGTFVLSATPNSDPHKLVGLRMHMIAGSLIGLLMLVRLVVRHATARPAPAVTGHALLDKAGRVVHGLLYLLVLGMAASGVALAVQAGLFDIVFGGQGALPANFRGYGARAAHGLIAGLLMALIALHIGAALYHQFILKDGLMARLKPCTRCESSDDAACPR